MRAFNAEMLQRAPGGQQAEADRGPRPAARRTRRRARRGRPVPCRGRRARLAFACLLGLVLCVALPGRAPRAEELTVAVAANFLTALRGIETEFEAASGRELRIVPGSTGQLYGQIVNGAPFDVLLAADQERPRLLAERGLGDPATVFTYAIGRLVLWSREPDRVGDGTLAALPEQRFRWLAIAEPTVAPYGAAAKQALEALGVWPVIEPRIVRGQNVAQTFAMVETGNAELGLVALSQALAYTGPSSYRIVPAELHEPISQDAIVLRRANGDPAAREFLAFLRSPAAAAIVERYGYAVPAAAD